MKIITRYKDYYDYCANLFGADDRVHYKRQLTLEYSQTNYKFKMENKIPTNVWDFKSTKLVFTVLIVGNESYLLYQEYDHETSSLKEAQSFHPTTKYVPSRLMYNKLAILSKDEYVMRMQKYFENNWNNTSNAELARLVGQPVFIIAKTRDDMITIEDHYPLLGDLDFQHVKSAEQLFQDLSMFISNELGQKKEEITPLTDKEKITSHGMDVKKSFRHRI